ncbi:MAG TPA: PilW family protein [Noviherbaspirillum sp.]|uniref:PilW family protein n=1 Tax=Noviherbaspirillum sp. TaxID=1926288 RepID=UPI002B4664B1|nr:PilW family protein [Noviherbaspirillum sp.]HJV85878.1 PilW family protein [Noviherbaspirillum sp.]
MNRPSVHRLLNVSQDFTRPDRGLTLVELMVSIALGLIIVMATSALLLSTKAGYLHQDDEARIQDAGRFAVDLIARSLRTASFRDWESTEAASRPGPAVFGLDARSLRGRTPIIDTPVAKAINGSDVLAIRFSGAGSGENGDGTMLNCAGFSVSADSAANDAEASRGWSIFYVAEDTTGESELYCKYRGDDAWTSQAVARGVESFQVLYGIDTDADGLPEQFLNATAITALDKSLGLSIVDGRDRGGKSSWNSVVAVKFALLIRGANNTQGGSGTTQYDLFGKGYADMHAAADPGVRIREASLPASVKGRQRKIFSTTIMLPVAASRGAA